MKPIYLLPGNLYLMLFSDLLLFEWLHYLILFSPILSFCDLIQLILLHLTSISILIFDLYYIHKLAFLLSKLPVKHQHLKLMDRFF